MAQEELNLFGEPTKRARKPRKSKAAKEAKPKVERVPNPCLEAKREVVEVPCDWYALRMDFTPSNAQMTRYCEFKGYTMVMNWQTESGIPAPTFDTTALAKLIEKYPDDPLFPLIERYRQIEKCLGTYVEGLILQPANL